VVKLAQALTIVEHALRHARELELPPMTVAVLDAGGHLVAFAREDGSSLLRERIARGKALGALNMGVGSRALAGRAAAHPQFINAVTTLAEGNLVPVPGGVLVRAPAADGEAGGIIGAVGVSGHQPDRDEECAVRGIEAAALTADPGA
jgi:uncharacterized protein GlcG (DUF336 family)